MNFRNRNKRFFSKLGSMVALLMFPLFTLAQQDSDCRFVSEDVEPIVSGFNPFFADYEWDKKNRVEIARICNSRYLIITQDGCRRHHTRFNLIFDPRLVQPNDSFWLEEAMSIFQKVYYGQQVLDEFQYDFADMFEEKFRVYGVNRRFNFPIGTRNFICKATYSAEKGASLSIEMISYIFKEKVVNHRTSPESPTKILEPNKP